VDYYDSNGNFLMMWDGSGSGAAIDNSGNIDVDDIPNARIVKLSPHPQRQFLPEIL
jgi:hypothetical protein